MASRQEKVVIRLNPDMKNRFQARAAEMGITMSALGAYVIGQWVLGQERMQGRIDQSIKEVIAEAVREEENSEGMEEFLNQFVPEFVAGFCKNRNGKAVSGACLDTGGPLE